MHQTQKSNKNACQHSPVRVKNVELTYVRSKNTRCPLTPWPPFLPEENAYVGVGSPRSFYRRIYSKWGSSISGHSQLSSAISTISSYSLLSQATPGYSRLSQTLPSYFELFTRVPQKEGDGLRMTLTLILTPSNLNRD
jgi:hypothetical protein